MAVQDLAPGSMASPTDFTVHGMNPLLLNEP